jgi:non-ribosomal peptide synthetase component F
MTLLLPDAGHFQTLLESIVANPEQRLCDLPLLTESDRHQLLVEWNDTQTKYLKDSCIHRLFEEQVEQTPDAIAIVFEDEQLTYRELNIRANKLAHHLQQLGVVPDVLVGICLERSIEMIVGLLGILKAGGAYLPLDPTYPQERLNFMLEDAQISILLTHSLLAPLFNRSFSEEGWGDRPPELSIVWVDKDEEAMAYGTATPDAYSTATPNASQTEENLTSSVTPDNLAYVIYTSGSTGKPKVF